MSYIWKNKLGSPSIFEFHLDVQVVPLRCVMTVCSFLELANEGGT